MGIKYTPATQSVQYPGGEFAVRGLSPEDIGVLLAAHYEALANLFDTYVTESAIQSLGNDVSRGQLNLGNVGEVIGRVMATAPTLIADVIARAAGEEDSRVVRLLPLTVQIDAVEKIIRLTLEAEGGLEKLVETVTRIAGVLALASADRSR